MIKRSVLSVAIVVVVLAICGISSHANNRRISSLVQQMEQVVQENPVYSGFKGVGIGTPMSEARQKLGNPTNKDDAQDLFTLNEKTTAQVYYDQDKKVYAVAVIYLGDKNVPTAKEVLGDDVQANPDGSVFKRVNYAKAGYWVAFSRTKGDDPMVTVTMQKSR